MYIDEKCETIWLDKYVVDHGGFATVRSLQWIPPGSFRILNNEDYRVATNAEESTPEKYENS